LTRLLTVYQPGLVGYERAFAAQKGLVSRLAEDGADRGALILLEHPPVITIGRTGSVEHVVAPNDTLQRHNVEVREVNRGGDVTYHGPGQIVGYPIINLNHHGRDVHRHMRRIEAVLVATLAEYGIAGSQRPGLTGVWVADRKIASIGIAVTRWVAYHGFALNVDPDLSHFDWIVPCGIRDVRMTSMRVETGKQFSPPEVEGRIVAHFCREFGFDAVERRVALKGDEP
jgi:lipoate-protein ligase B